MVGLHRIWPGIGHLNLCVGATNNMAKVDNHPHIYPSLGEGESSATNFRIQSVVRLREELNNEITAREALYKKYQRAVNVLVGLDTGATASGIILSGVGTGLLATLIVAPAVPAVMGAAAGCRL